MESNDPTDCSSVDAHHELEILIHDAYANCIRSFESCKVCAHLPPESLQLVHDEANRFEIWATNTGSSLDPSLPSSLDHRLRNSPGTREMVVLLLRAVRVNLDYASRIFDQEPETLDSLRDQYGSGNASETQQGSTSGTIANSLSTEALLAVHGLVSQLKKLSAAIRKATANEYNVQAMKLRDTDKDGNDMGKDDEIWAQQIVNYHFQDKKDGAPGSTDEMRDIISTGLSFRMRRFRDWKRHFEKHQKRQEAIARAELVRESERLEYQGEDGEGSKQGEDSGDTGARESIDIAGSAPSKVQGGVVQPSLALSKQSFQSSRFEAPKSVSQSTAVSASVRSVVAGVFMDWPRPPQDATGTGQVRCPYCFELLDEQEVSSKTKWRKHVKKDLEPYGCFYPECNKALLKMFASEAKWIGHIRAAHTPGGTWVCRMMPHNSSPGAVVVLGTEDEFKKHLQSEHAGMYPKSRVDTMAKGAYRPHQAKVEDMFRDECPMRCPASLDESPETAIVLGVPHVTNHLLSLALQALPERSVGPSESEFVDDKDSDEHEDGDNDDMGKGPSPAKKPAVRGTILDGMETLPDPTFEDPSEPPTTGDERDMKLQLSGDRLNFYGYLPLVQRQHHELTDISQAHDPTMETFIKQQMGINDVSVLQQELIQREARRRVAVRRWNIVRTSIGFLSVLGAFREKGKHGLADSEDEQHVKNTTVNRRLSTVLETFEPTKRHMFLTVLRRDLSRMLVQKDEYDRMLDELKDQERPGAGFEFRRIESSLAQTKVEISDLLSKIREVELDNLEAEEGAVFPAMYLVTGRRSGRLGFDRFDQMKISLVRVGGGMIGRAEVQIRLLFTKTKWGILGDSGTPAGIIYMDFDIRTPKDSALRSWRVEISLQEKISDKSKPKDDKHHALRFTDCYGPKQLRGPKVIASRVRSFTPTVEVLGPGAGGIGVSKEYMYHTELPRWEFKGQLSPSNPRSPFYDTLAWEMESSEDTAPLDRHHGSLFHVAFAIEHNAHEFYLKTSVTGKLASTTQDRIRRLLKFGSSKDSNNEMVTKFQFPSRESYLTSNTLALDTLAKGLDGAMTYENIDTLPREMDPSEQQQLPLEFTRYPSYQPSHPSSPYSSPVPASSTGGRGETPPATSRNLQGEMRDLGFKELRLLHSELPEPRTRTRRGNTTDDVDNGQDREEDEELQPEEEDEEYFTGVEDASEDEDSERGLQDQGKKQIQQIAPTESST